MANKDPASSQLRRRKLLRVGLFAGGGAVALLLVAALLGPLLIDANDFAPLLERMAEQRLRRAVAIGELSATFLPPSVTVKDVRVAGEEGGEPLLVAKSVRVGVRILPLLRRRLDVTSVSLVEPAIVLVRDAEGRWLAAESMKGASNESDRPAAAGQPTARPRAIEVSDGALTILDAHVVPGRVSRLEVRDLDVDASGIGGRDGVRLELSGSLADGGSLAFDGEVGPAGRVDGRASAEALALEKLAPWMSGAIGPGPLQGTVTGEIDVRRGEESELSIAGDVKAAGLLLPKAARGTRPLDAEIGIDATRRGGDIEMKRLSLTTGATSLSGSGRVRTGKGTQEIEIELADSKIVPGELAAALRALGVTPPEQLPAGEEPLQVAGAMRVVRDVDGAQPGRVREIALQRVRLRGGHVVARRDAGGKLALQLAGDSERSAPRASKDAVELQARDVKAEGLTLDFVDASQGKPVRTRLEDVSLSVGEWSKGSAKDVTAAGGVGGGRVSASGGWAQGGSASGRVEAKGVALSALAAFLPTSKLGEGGTVDARLDLAAGRGKEPGRLKGDVHLRGLRVRGAERAGPLDLPVEVDATVDARRITFRELELGLPGGPVRLTGHLDRGERAGFDLGTDGTARLSPADVKLLSALLGDRLPFTLEAQEPVAANVRLTRAGDGPVRASGDVALRRVAVRAEALAEPLLVDQARIELAGETARVEDATLSLGRSRLQGSLTLEDFDSPRVGFELAATEADLDELFSFVTKAREEGRKRAVQGGKASLMDKLVAQGRLRVDKATFGGLSFRDFTSRVTLDRGELSFESAQLTAYDGSARGSADIRMSGESGFRLDGTLQDVLVHSLLEAGVGYRDIAGTGDATLSLAGPTSLAQALAQGRGQGSLTLRDGELRSLSFFSALEQADVFGERSIAELGRRLASEGTTFERATARYTLAGGVVSLSELELVTPDAVVTGKGTVRLSDQALALDAEALFSDELSQTLRDEGSKAAKFFWDAKSQRVMLPLRLTGTVKAPKATIDWASAARNYGIQEITDRVDEKTGGLLGALLGRPREEDAPPSADVRPPFGGDDRSGAVRAGEREPQEPARDRESDGRAEAAITEARFGGNFLVPDLVIRASVTGADVTRVRLVVKDDSGNERYRDEQALRSELAARRAGDAVVGGVKVDGDGLVGARSLTVELTPMAGDAAAGPTSRRVVERASPF